MPTDSSSLQSSTSDLTRSVKSRDPSKDEVVKTYSRWASTYDATFGRIVGRYHWHIARFVAEIGAQRVIEVGVGTGLSLAHYPAGISVLGVDICPRMLEKARRRLDSGAAHARVELQLVDGEELPYAQGTFDAVVLPFVISVTPNPQRLLAEAFRVLAPGGRLLIVNHFAGVRGLRWLEKLFSPLAKQIGFQSDLDLTTLLEGSPLQLVEVRRLRPIGFFTLVHLRKS
jgi:phosphatidylethanolamine/phosphatidyl-N-methylethanolamine N-methyltransferase